MKIDAHLHLFATRWSVPGSSPFSGEKKTNHRRKNFKPLETYWDMTGISNERKIGFLKRMAPPTLEEHARLLISDMDEGSIDKAVVMIMDTDYLGKGLRVPYRDQLKEAAAVRDKYPGRFLLFCGIDPRRGKEGVAVLEWALKELGYAGMKYLPHFGFSPNDRELCYPLYEKCVEYGVPVASNCGALASNFISRYCDPFNFEEVARDFPELNICLAHCGRLLWAETAIGMASVKHNVYVDLSDWQAKDPLSLESLFKLLRKAMDTPARRKIMFGSDWPIFSHLYSEKEWAELFITGARQHGFDFKPDELELFFSQNAQDFLDLDLS